MTFAKQAAEELVTPEELDEQDRRSHWKKWLGTAAGLGALGLAGGMAYKNWPQISKTLDRFHVGQAPGPLQRGVNAISDDTSLPTAGFVTGALAPLLSPLMGKTMPGSNAHATSTLNRIGEQSKNPTGDSKGVVERLSAAVKRPFNEVLEAARQDPQHPLNAAANELGFQPGWMSRLGNRVGNKVRGALGRPEVEQPTGIAAIQNSQRGLKQFVDRLPGMKTNLEPTLGIGNKELATHLGTIRGTPTKHFEPVRSVGHGILGAVAGAGAQMLDDKLGDNGL